MHVWIDSYVVTIAGMQGIANVQVAFLQYKFKGEEHTIHNVPHKTSKSSICTPYKQTHPSTIQGIKEVAKGCKPSSAFELVDSEMVKGVLENCLAVKDRFQIYNNSCIYCLQPCFQRLQHRHVLKTSINA